MKIVSPDDVTTLIANKHYQAIAFCTARAALRHLMTGRVKGIDASGGAYGWEDDGITVYPTANTVVAYPENDQPGYNWASRNLQYYPDQPALRSSAGLSGETIEWAIPTIVICTSYFGYKVRKNEKVNLRKLYRHYKGICQLCLQRGPINDMTIDHIYPRSLGGTNHDFNLVLAHRSCNHAKGAQTPYLNAEGKEVKARPMLRTGVIMPDIPLRDEWKMYMMIND